jgi:hypothetical protein
MGRGLERRSIPGVLAVLEPTFPEIILVYLSQQIISYLELIFQSLAGIIMR